MGLPASNRLKLYASAAGLQVRSWRTGGPAAAGALLPWHSASTVVRQEVLEDRAPILNGVNALSVCGLIGILEAFGVSYLLAITEAEEVARLNGRSIYKITGVAAIPLASQYDAEIALGGLFNALKQGDSRASTDEPVAFLAGAFDADEIDDHGHAGTSQSTLQPSISKSSRPSSPPSTNSGIAEDVYRKFGGPQQQRDGGNGSRSIRHRNQERLQSPNYPSTHGSRKSSFTADLTARLTAGSVSPAHRRSLSQSRQASSTVIADDRKEDLAINTMPRIVQAVRSLIGSSGTFFFSFDVDITRRLKAASVNGFSKEALWKQVDPEYFWNQNLLEDLIDAGQGDLCIPIMQGFIGQRTFIIGSASNDPPERSYTLTIISRRSTLRTGLRYLRRGVDTRGNVANAVETEQILSFDGSAPASKDTLSFVQIRGSIPLFFSQNPYAIKPIPMMTRHEKANGDAFTQHFEKLQSRYGDVFAISLVNKHGNERQIGEEYERAALKLSELHTDEHKEAQAIKHRNLAFQWVDFHQLCHGMHFENVSQIVDMVSYFLKDSAWTGMRDGKQTSSQCGVVRTNCMDCLDRTNVFQSAVAERVLEMQLKFFGEDVNEARSMLTDSKRAIWFNSLWADNGDAISKAYTSTSALKGDFVRTRVRNWVGVLNDARLTVSRYYHNLFGDYFTQGVIDYCLGNAGEDIFEEIESGRVRLDEEERYDYLREQRVLDQVARHVFEAHDNVEDDGLQAGWVFHEVDDHGKVMEKVLLLLGNKNACLVRYDWDDEKITHTEIAKAQDIARLSWGAMVTDLSSSKQRDMSRNVGLQIDTKRSDDGTGKWLLKHLPATSGTSTAYHSESDSTKRVVDEIVTWRRQQEHKHPEVFRNEFVVEEKAIIDLDTAKWNQGWFQWAAKSMQKAIWS